MAGRVASQKQLTVNKTEQNTNTSGDVKAGNMTVRNTYLACYNKESVALTN